MKKYKLLKELPTNEFAVGWIITEEQVYKFCSDPIAFSDFFELQEDKPQTVWDLKK